MNISLKIALKQILWERFASNIMQYRVIGFFHPFYNERQEHLAVIGMALF